MTDLKHKLIAYLEYYAQLGVTHVQPLNAPPLLVSATVAVKKISQAKPMADRSERAPAPAIKGAMGAILNLVKTGRDTESTQVKVNQLEGGNSKEILTNLYNAFEHCRACALGTTRKLFVFGEGPPDAELMFVGEGPGRREDESGRPFVGDAGSLLSRIIEAMSLTRQNVFIANVVKCRPPDNRTPLPDEMATCSPILIKQIETVNPKVIVALGGTALRFFKDAPTSIVRTRGTFFDWRGYRVMPTFHPAYILRNPAAKRDVWDDMQKVMVELGLGKP